jgi:DNA polymerase III subunit delta
MITLLIGENSFEIERKLHEIKSQFDGVCETVDGAEVELKQLPDLLMGATLFASSRLVVLKRLSENKALWNGFEAWIPRISDDTHLVLIDSKPDKRTKTFKELQKVATVHDFQGWSERDTLKAEQWAMKEAATLGFSLDKKSAQLLVARVGADQWLLYRALEKLAVVDEVSAAVIEELIEANPLENVFNLFEAALRGDAPRVKRMIETLELTEDAYRLFGLLSGQAFQLAALSVSEKQSADVAKELGAHPFALSKLAPHAKKLGKGGARKVIAIFAEADSAMKTSAGDPWLLLERALVKVACL